MDATGTNAAKCCARCGYTRKEHDGVFLLHEFEEQFPHASSNSAAKLDPYPKVVGWCPACHFDHLFLGAGGYVTCSWVDCPDPGAAQRLIEQRRAIPTSAAEIHSGMPDIYVRSGDPRKPEDATPNRAWKRPANPYPLVEAIAEKMDGLDSLEGRRQIAWEILDLLEATDA